MPTHVLPWDRESLFRSRDRPEYSWLKRAKCGAVKNAASLPFCEYVRQCLRQAGVAPLSEAEEAEVGSELAPLLGQWRRVVVFFALRALLAPLWEALLLLDRLLFLGERGHLAALVPLFDPALSPRNYAVVGVRRLPGADTDAAFVAALPPEAVAICDGGDPASGPSSGDVIKNTRIQIYSG